MLLGKLNAVSIISTLFFQFNDIYGQDFGVDFVLRYLIVKGYAVVVDLPILVLALWYLSYCSSALTFVMCLGSTHCTHYVLEVSPPSQDPLAGYR